MTVKNHSGVLSPNKDILGTVEAQDFSWGIHGLTGFQYFAIQNSAPGAQIRLAIFRDNKK